MAPETEQSRRQPFADARRPLRVRRIGERRFAVDGTPTDCVLLAIKHILKERKPDLVLSGVNRGSNLGEDVTYSGTVAAAMEATLLGVPAIAMSQHCDRGAAGAVATAAALGAEVVRSGWSRCRGRATS